VHTPSFLPHKHVQIFYSPSCKWLSVSHLEGQSVAWSLITQRTAKLFHAGMNLTP